MQEKTDKPLPRLSVHGYDILALTFSYWNRYKDTSEEYEIEDASDYEADHSSNKRSSIDEDKSYNGEQRLVYLAVRFIS